MVSRWKVGNSQHFPTNLHTLLDEADKGNHDHIVSWCSQGKSFKIHNEKAMVPLLCKYFRQTRFKSFLRQLQSYGFDRTHSGCDRGIVSHRHFIRGRRSECFQMSRKRSGAASRSCDSNVSPSTVSSESLKYSQPALPSNRIESIRTAFSSPLLGNSPQHGGLQQIRQCIDMSEFKNSTFDFRDQASAQAQAQALESGPPFPFMKSHAVNSHVIKNTCSDPEMTQMMPSPSASNNKGSHMRIPSAPTMMTTQRRESILECDGIDHSLNSNTSSGDVRIPQDPYPPSIKESPSTDCTDPQQLPSQQQVMVQAQTHPGQYNGQGHQLQYALHRAAQRHPFPAYQVQQSNEPQNQIQVQHVQYQWEREAQNRLQHQPIPKEQVDVQQGHFQLAPQPQVQVQHVCCQQCQHCQQDTPPRNELLANQIKELRENLLAKQREFGDQEDRYLSAKLQTQARFHNIGEKPKGQHQQQVEDQGVHHQQFLLSQQQQQQCEPQGQQQTHGLQPQLQLRQSTQVQHHPAQREPVAPAQPTNSGILLGFGAPRGFPVCSLQSSLKPAASNFCSAPSIDFDVSFSATEFEIGCGGKGDNQNLTSCKAPISFPSHDISTTTDAPSFSAAITTNTNQTGELATSNVFASTTSASSGTTGGCTAALHLATTTNAFDPPQKRPPDVPTPFSQHKQKQLHHYFGWFAPSATTPSATIEAGTIESLLRNGVGFDEWDIDMKPEDPFAPNPISNNRAETGDSIVPALRLSHQEMQPDHN